MTILLIRHGETCENKNHVVQPADVSLSALGLQQADLLAERLSTWDVSQILCSDLPRAKETASQIAAKSPCEVTLTTLLRERSFGSLRGKTYAEIGFDFLAEGYSPPEGESWQEFELRIAQAWQSIVALAATTSGRLAVVTHGLVCRALVNNFLQAKQLQMIPDRWDNTSLTEFTKTAPYEIILLNNTEHLDNRDPSPKIGAVV